MALQVWLPLTEDLTQQGLSGVEAVNNGATVNNDGKLGKCYQFDGNDYITLPIKFLGSDYSYSVWVYTTSASTTQTLGCCRATVGNGFSLFLINGKIRIDPGGKNVQWTTNYTYPINTWFHIAVTCNNGKIKYYINGEYKQEYNMTLNESQWGTLFSIGASQANGSGYGNYLTGQLNDIRIYDHCLSTKEIKELSKGLILHYKLDDSYLSKGENIMPNHLEMALTSPSNASTGTWRLAGSNTMTRERVLIIDSPEGECYGFQNTGVQTYNDGSCYGIDNFSIVGNTVYTISMWARCISGENAYAGFHVYTSVEKGGSHTGTLKNYKTTPLPATGEWTKCWYTFTTESANTRNIYIGIVTEETSVITQMCCVHIEKVDNTLDNIVYDTSGYNNNGTIIGTLANSINTPKYFVSTSFDGIDDGILIEDLQLSNIINSEVTYSFWIKPNGEAGARSVYFGSYSSTSWSIEKTTGNLLRLYWNGSPDETATGATIADNIWQHVCITKNGTNDIKVYINGEQKWTSTKAHNTLTFPTTYRIGRDVRSGDNTPYKGLMSDFRIYATALSAEDVAELYHTVASIDNKGNLFCGEVVE